MDRVLNQFFGEFFAEDADEELASDMSERWAAFAKTSDPNHDGSKTQWGSWLPSERGWDELDGEAGNEDKEDFDSDDREGMTGG